jgi:hypothetical protein
MKENYDDSPDDSCMRVLHGMKRAQQAWRGRHVKAQGSLMMRVPRSPHACLDLDGGGVISDKNLRKKRKKK